MTTPFQQGGGSFAGPRWENSYEDTLEWRKDDDLVEDFKSMVDDFVVSRDEIPLHFYSHTMHAFQILGYKHPDLDIRKEWNAIYVRMAHALHLWPETEEQMDERLSDSEVGWRKREDPAGSCST